MENEYKGSNRRNLHASREATAAGIMRRVDRENTPLIALGLRTRGLLDNREQIQSDVSQRVQELYGVPPALEDVKTFERLVPLAARYKGQYDRLPDEMKTLMSWQSLEALLFANGGKLLRLGEEMQERGVLFALLEDKALIADGGVSLMKPSYPLLINSRYDPRYQRDHYPLASTIQTDSLVKTKMIGGKIITDEKGTPIPSGYRPFNSLEEMRLFEKNTGLKACETSIRRGSEVQRRHSHDSDSTYGTGAYYQEYYLEAYRRVLEVE